MNDPRICSYAAPSRRNAWLLALAAAAALFASCKLDGPARGARPDILPGTVGELVVADADTGTGMSASPSPDGKRIAVAAQGALWVMPAGGGRAVRISDSSLQPAAPAWSPDGKRIAFQNYAPEGHYHLWTIEPDGRGARALTSGPNDDREPAWLPDGSGLVFASDRSNDGQYKLWRVALPGAPPVRITSGPGAEGSPAISPDGARLAYVDGANVMVVALDGGDPAMVGPGSAPAWAPDTGGLIYQNATGQLVVGGVQVTRDELVLPMAVRFLPNGRFLYMVDGTIRTRDAKGGDPADIAFRAGAGAHRPASQG
jgi:dipeptidyl aminopeptidase/acylaminoacyl peptidase